MSILECHELTKEYGGWKALHNVSFEIQENTITGLIGRNGAGKSTLLKIVTGLIRETSGEVSVFGRQPFNDLNVSANTIFLDDQTVFPMTMNLGEILQTCRQFYKNWDMELANRLFSYFSFPKKAYYQQLSKGMRSTFNMIVGLSAKCTLTIFDEPTTGMDHAVRQDFYRALLKAYMDYPRTIILSSHLLNEMETLLENILLIKKGKLILHAPVSSLKEFAISLEGPRNAVEGFIDNKEVFHQKMIGDHQLNVALKDELSDGEKQDARKQGIQVKAVPIDDLTMYLTSETKGGIDDVFNRG